MTTKKGSSLEEAVKLIQEAILASDPKLSQLLA
jgi:hypothetical protein